MPPGELQSLTRETIQSQVKQDNYSGLTLLMWLVAGEGVVSPWWSRQRDIEMRAFWRKPDHLAGAVYTLESRLSTIPVKVVPRDMTIRSSLAQADKFQLMLDNLSEFGQGFDTFISKWVEDILTQDNGGFAEIIGEGDPLGPILGMPYGIASLDSARCQRTPNPEYPVIYQDITAGPVKLHYSRVAFASLQPSPAAEMLGVGYCSVSRCLNTAQHLLDILVYKQEKLGSRPHRSILITKGGLDPDDVKAAFALANDAQDNQALTRYSKNVVVGNSNLKDAGIDIVDLAGLPDGFSEDTSVTLGMAAIALAFGVDARELWPATVSGATRADALVSHLKARMKGIGQLIQITERAIGPKLLPPTLGLVFDYQDDAQDHEVANIRKVRSERHQIDVTLGTLDIRTARQQMVGDGDMTQQQFDELELGEGRLPDGTPVLTLFYSADHRAMLNLGVPDPIGQAGDPNLKPIIEETRSDLIRDLATTTQFRARRMIREALAALDALEQKAKDAAGQESVDRMNETLDEEGQTVEAELAGDGIEVGDESMTEEQVAEPAEEAKALMVVRKALGLIQPIYQVPAGAMPPPAIIIQNPNDRLLERLAKALESGNATMTKALKERDHQLFKQQAEMLALAVETILDKQADGDAVLASLSKTMLDGLGGMVDAIRSIKPPTVNVTSQPTINVKPSEASVTVKMPVVTEEEVSVVDRDYAGKVSRLRKTRTYK
jgi:hypothetical protein